MTARADAADDPPEAPADVREAKDKAKAVLCGELDEADLLPMQVAQMQGDYAHLQREFEAVQQTYAERIRELERSLGDEWHAREAARARVQLLEDEVQYHVTRAKMVADYWHSQDATKNEGIAFLKLKLEEFGPNEDSSGHVSAQLAKLTREHEQVLAECDELRAARRSNEDRVLAATRAQTGLLARLQAAEAQLAVVEQGDVERVLAALDPLPSLEQQQASLEAQVEARLPQDEQRVWETDCPWQLEVAHRVAQLERLSAELDSAYEARIRQADELRARTGESHDLRRRILSFDKTIWEQQLWLDELVKALTETARRLEGLSNQEQTQHARDTIAELLAHVRKEFPPGGTRLSDSPGVESEPAGP